MRLLQFQTKRLIAGLAVVIVGALGATGFFTRNQWLPRIHYEKPSESDGLSATEAPQSAAPGGKILLTDQAIANLGLSVKPAQPGIYWKTIEVPGMIVDRPGRSDRGIVCPVTGVVAKINSFPGDTVRPGNVLFNIRLLSESLHQNQSDLFKATQDIELAEAQRKRLQSAGAGIAESRIIEVDNQIKRLELAVKALGRELINRGLSQDQIDRVKDGEFVDEIAIVVPAAASEDAPLTTDLVSESADGEIDQTQPTFEVQELSVELGHQVQAGQTLCLLANHRMLAIEGRAFRDETPLLERSVAEGWPVEVNFQEVTGTTWPQVDQVFRIQHLANTIDPVNRTFAFLMPLKNESKVVEEDGRTQLLWRYRPGQKLRILLRVDKLDNVFVFPAEAVAHDGAEAFVFTQNVNTFERQSVRIVFQDRQNSVVANDGSLVPGAFVVQNSAAQLNRMSKSQSSSVPKGYHIHADGSLHKNEDEGK